MDGFDHITISPRESQSSTTQESSKNLWRKEKVCHLTTIKVYNFEYARKKNLLWLYKRKPESFWRDGLKTHVVLLP